jgi:hypothetical protein
MNFGTQLYEFDLGLHQFEYTGHKCAHHDEGEREEVAVMWSRWPAAQEGRRR